MCLNLAYLYFYFKKIAPYVISANKWVCDCRLLWLRELFIKRNITDHGKTLYCKRPKRFQSRKLVDLSVSDLLQWPDECPPSCDCTCVSVENGDFFVRVDCSRRNMSEVREILLK